MLEGVVGVGVIGVGTDLVDLDRFRTVLERRPLMPERLFTSLERESAGQARDPVPRLGARFAAKEAVLKALGLGLGGMRMAEIEVVRNGDGKPEVMLHGAAQQRAAAQGVTGLRVSLSHTAHLASATVIALGTGWSETPTAGHTPDTGSQDSASLGTGSAATQATDSPASGVSDSEARSGAVADPATTGSEQPP